jgi:hypothetical protein
VLTASHFCTFLNLSSHRSSIETRGVVTRRGFTKLWARIARDHERRPPVKSTSDFVAWLHARIRQSYLYSKYCTRAQNNGPSYDANQTQNIEMLRERTKSVSKSKTTSPSRVRPSSARVVGMCALATGAKIRNSAHRGGKCTRHARPESARMAINCSAVRSKYAADKKNALPNKLAVPDGVTRGGLIGLGGKLVCRRDDIYNNNSNNDNNNNRGKRSLKPSTRRVNSIKEATQYILTMSLPPGYYCAGSISVTMAAPVGKTRSKGMWLAERLSERHTLLKGQMLTKCRPHNVVVHDDCCERT